MLIVFDTDLMAQVKQEADKLFVTPDASALIAQFKLLQKEMEEFEKQLKEEIKETAEKFDPTFKSISGDHCRISYSDRGTKYLIDESLRSDLDPSFYEVTAKLKPNTGAIDAYIETTGQVPVGVILPDRKKSISISVKE